MGKFQPKRPDSLLTLRGEEAKALIALYGPTEAARITGIKVGTLYQWCRRYGWKAPLKALPSGKDVGDIIRESLEKSKERSTLDLAKFTENAAREAASHKKPLEVARKVRDVAGVYSTLWPAAQESELIEGAILFGNVVVPDDEEELKEANVREIVPDERPAGD